MNKELNKEILEIIVTENDPINLKERLANFHPYDIARAIYALEAENRVKLYASLSEKVLADIFSYLEVEDSAELFSELNLNQGANILEQMEVDDAVDLLQEIDPEEVTDYLNLLNSQTRADISYLSKEQKSSVGSIMTTNYIEISEDCDVKEAMKILIREANETEVIDPLYVTSAGKLVGILDLKTLIIARSPMKIHEIMKTNYIYVDKTEEIEDAAGIIRDYSLAALPVLEEGHLVGIVTIDDAIDVIEDEASFQYGSLAAVSDDIDERVNIFALLKKRLPWLIGLLILNLLTSTVIGQFEDIIMQTTILIFFQSLILDMVGNIGTQTLAVTIRGLSRGELNDNTKIKKNFFREFKISLITSFALAIITFLVILLFLLFNDYQGSIIQICIILTASMFLALNIAAVTGISFPIILEKIGFDPAVASGPLITTINDMIAVVIYYGLATVFLSFI
ncbi:MAG: magnesium transporter [Bacilli bacterium]|nr:magnesium transporter [Bacilli bacterium]